MVAFKGHFDGRVIVPEEPVDLRPGERLSITAEPVPTSTPVDAESSLEWMAKNAIVDPSLPSDASHQHDHYLYGTPKKPQEKP
jgi:hypothetical protein